MPGVQYKFDDTTFQPVTKNVVLSESYLIIDHFTNPSEVDYNESWRFLIVHLAFIRVVRTASQQVHFLTRQFPTIIVSSLSTTFQCQMDPFEIRDHIMVRLRDIDKKTTIRLHRFVVDPFS
jgi:hypothetical protein